MTKQIIQFSILFVILTFVQVLVCNNISVFNIATPFIFIYFLVRLPITISTNWMLTLSFLSGLIVDIFSDTQGMNALACTLLAVARNPIIRLYVPRHDEITDTVPSIKSLGIAVYMKYLISMILCYCSIIILIEAFTFHNLLFSVLRIVCSTLLTFVLILGIDSIVNTKHEKRL